MCGGQEKHSGITRYCVGKAQEGVGVSVFAKIPPPAATTAIMRWYRVASIMYGCTLQPPPATLLLQPLTVSYQFCYQFESNDPIKSLYITIKPNVAHLTHNLHYYTLVLHGSPNRILRKYEISSYDIK